MAHKLYFRDGKADVISVRKTMWHNEGTVLPIAPGFDEAITLAGLDYEVEKVQAYRDDGQGGYVHTNAFVNVRKDTNLELGTVSAQYEVVQNTDAFRVLEPLIDEGVAQIETAGVLREGADAWMLVQFDLDRFPENVRKSLGGNDKVLPYALVANNFAGRRGILCALTGVRVVCANTLGAAEGSGVNDQITIMHTESARQKLVDAAHSLWGDVIRKYQSMAEAYDVMKKSELTTKDFDRLVTSVLTEDPRDKKGWNPEATMAKTVIVKHISRKFKLHNLWTNGAGHTGEKNAWYAYNAAVEALDHESELWPARSGVYRTASALTGSLRDKKEQVFTNLFAFAGGKK